jgi:hypothetical protein
VKIAVPIMSGAFHVDSRPAPRAAAPLTR